MKEFLPCIRSTLWEGTEGGLLVLARDHSVVKCFRSRSLYRVSPAASCRHESLVVFVSWASLGSHVTFIIFQANLAHQPGLDAQVNMKGITTSTHKVLSTHLFSQNSSFLPRGRASLRGTAGIQYCLRPRVVTGIFLLSSLSVGDFRKISLRND
jgi:hypothetical protein